MPAVIREAPGVFLQGRRIRSLVFSTDLAVICHCNADAVLAGGIIDAVISEGVGPAHENPDEAVAAVRDYVREAYKELADLTPDELIAQRQGRFARF